MLFCLGSAAAFGAMAVLGKLAYDDGATVGTLLALRFSIAAALFWVLAPWGEVRAVRALDAGRQPPGLGLPLVAEHEVEVADGQRGQRLLGLGLDELAAEPRRRRGEALHRRECEAERDRFKAGDPGAPRDRAGRRREVGLGLRGAVEERLCVLDEHAAGVGEPDTAAGSGEQRNAGVALEDRQLLGDGRGRELERVGDGGDRLAFAQLAQEAEAAKVKHRYMFSCRKRNRF